MYSGRCRLYAGTAEGSSGIGRASDVSGFSARTNLVNEILVLRQLAQLEVASHYLTIACFKLITEFLNGVLIDECASCFTLSMDGVGDVVGILSSVIASGVNVAVDTAAAILHSKAELGDALASCIEAITNTIGDTTKLSIYVLIVESFEEIRTSDCTLYCSVVATAEEAVASTKYSKPYKINEPFVTG